MLRILPLAILLAVAACAGPESRIESALTGAGLSPRVSKCMASRMVDQLSVNQLLKLRSMSKLSEQPMGELSAREFLRRVRALQDPEILAVTSTALARCSLGV